MYSFKMKEDIFTGTAVIFLDQQPLHAQSTLNECQTNNFFLWYQKMPHLLDIELNDQYILEAECGEVEFMLLKYAFQQKSLCCKLRHIPIKNPYTVAQRMSWLDELTKDNDSSHIPKFSLMASKNSEKTAKDIYNSLSIEYRKFCEYNKKCVVNIFINDTDCDPLYTPSSSQNDDITIHISKSNADTKLYDNNGHHADINKAKVNKLIEKWIDCMIFYPYFHAIMKKLSKSMVSNDFLTNAKIRMLTSLHPIVNIKSKDRIEYGTSEPFEVQEFPESSLTMSVSDKNILKINNGMFSGARTGTAEVYISGEDKNIICKKKIEVYFVQRVTSINLKLNSKGGIVIENENFSVTADLQPLTAVNRSSAVWSFSPSDMLKDNGSGHFTALKNGICTISVTAGNITKSINIDIKPKVKDLALPSFINVKLKKTYPLNIKLRPDNSAYRYIDCVTGQSSIAVWNDITKEIETVSEGSTSLIVSIYDADQNIILQKSIHVEVLPEKTIITPSTLPTLLIILCICSILIRNTPIFNLFIISNFCMAIADIIWSMILIKIKGKTKTHIAELIIGIIGLIIAVILLLIR